MLKLEHINVIYNEGTKLEKRALDDVSVHIRPGEFVTILGSNGAGKSTFFNVITGQAPTQSGNVILDGKDITHEKSTFVRKRSDASFKIRPKEQRQA